MNFYQYLNVSKFHEKSNILRKKLRKWLCCKTKDWIQNDDQNRWSRSLPSTCIDTTSWLNISFSNVGQFLFMLFNVHDQCFLCFFTVFWSGYSILFQKMCNSASYHKTECEKSEKSVNAEKKLSIAFVFIKLVTMVQDMVAKCITSLSALLYIY